MVASTVAKLATIIDAEEDSTRRMGFETILPLREGNGPTLFCFHPASGLPGSACSRVISIHNGRLSAFSHRAPMAPCRRRQTWMKSAKRIWQRYLNNNRAGPLLPAGVFAGRYAGAGYWWRGCGTRGEQVAFFGLPDTWPPETQNWQEKEANGLDPEVLKARINRNARPSWRHSREVLQRSCLTTIEGNYADAVRLLTDTAHSVPFDGKATLFVAERTLQEGMSPERAWSPWIAELDIYRQDCAHVDIISRGV